MTKDFPKISAAQLFCILLLSRAAIEITTPNSSSAPREAIIAIIGSELLRFLFALPLIIFSLNHDNFHRYVYNKNKVMGWISACFGAVILVGAAIKTLYHTSGFTEKNLIISGSSWMIYTIAAIFAVYAAYMGVEAVARSGVLFLVAAGIITVLVFIADIPYYQRSDVWNTSENSGLLGDIIIRFLNGGDYLIFAALLPYVNKKHKNSSFKTAMYFSLFSIIVPIFLCVFNFLILREFYALSEYPSVASASLSDIAVFKRLDGIFSAIWALCAALRCGMMLLSAALMFAALKRVSEQKKNEDPKTSPQ